MESINYNETILTNYQKKYPNLAEFIYDTKTDSLIYEGNIIKLNGYGLSRIDPIFFSMNPDDIYLYFKNAFYQNSNENVQMLNYFNQFVITEEEASFIDSYINRYNDRLQILKDNKELFEENQNNVSIQEFYKDVNDAKKIIDYATLNNRNDQSALDLLANAYQNNNSLNEGMHLTRKKASFGGYSEFAKNEEYLKRLKEKQHMGAAGYTSIILIVTSALTFGMFLAIKLMGM